jgi:hypothetical protein
MKIAKIAKLQNCKIAKSQNLTCCNLQLHFASPSSPQRYSPPLHAPPPFPPLLSYTLIPIVCLLLSTRGRPHPLHRPSAMPYMLRRHPSWLLLYIFRRNRNCNSSYPVAVDLRSNLFLIPVVFSPLHIFRSW